MGRVQIPSEQQQQQASVMEMAKLGGRLSRAGSGSTVRNLKSAAVRINLTCTRVRVSPAQGKRRQPNHRITIHHQRQKDRFCLDWTLYRESGDDSTVSYLTSLSIVPSQLHSQAPQAAPISPQATHITPNAYHAFAYRHRACVSGASATTLSTNPPRALDWPPILQSAAFRFQSFQTRPASHHLSNPMQRDLITAARLCKRRGGDDKLATMRSS
jgi:hypothetical protein